MLELSIDQSMTQQEIAAATRLPLGTVKTHARRGLMRLRELLESAPPFMPRNVQYAAETDSNPKRQRGPRSFLANASGCDEETRP